MTLPNQVNPLLQAPVPAYSVYNSLRFRSSATAYLNRTPASAGNQQKFTLSFWVKIGQLGTGPTLFTAGANSTTAGYFTVYFDNTNVFGVIVRDGATSKTFLTAAVYRDPSSWYHIVVAVDTTQTTAANQIKLYVNGVLIGWNSSTALTVSMNTLVNSTSTQQIGVYRDGSGNFIAYLDGYLAEFNLVDAQQLTPSSFGAYNSFGVWQPARYTGTYGTNGFYLKFSDTASLTTSSNVGLGKDFSGNANYWATNNISITAGTTYDPMLDSPTLTSATVANYCTINVALPKFTASDATVVYSSANLQTNNAAGGGTANVSGTLGSLTGKFYYECYCNVSSAAGNIVIGLNTVTSGYNMVVGIRNNGTNSGFTITSGAAFSYTTGDMIGVAFDLSASSCIYYKNGVQQLTGTYGITQSVTAWAQMNGATDSLIWNFGQRPFSYTPPSGYVALNAYNLPTPTIPNGATVMAATTYTGNGANNRPISNGGSMQPDLAWVKNRTSAYDNVLVDSVRGYTVALSSNLTQNEAYFGQLFDNATINGSNYNGFYPGGFIVNGNFRVNNNTDALVGWQWKAGGPGGSSNTNGSITSTVSVNATAGFSVVTWTGNGVNAATVGHGLGVAPNMIIVKSRTLSASSTGAWYVYHSAAGAANYLVLNTTAASTAGGQWYSTTPTSSVFYLGGTGNYVNESGSSQVAYCWSAVAGYSAFGSYTGNGSADGPFVYTGFRPRWIMIKRTDTTANWRILDTSRDTYNVESAELYPNLSNAESAFASLDGLSNGFKIRNTDSAYNASGGTYVYAAFAENPFKYALAR